MHFYLKLLSGIILLCPVFRASPATIGTFDEVMGSLFNTSSEFINTVKFSSTPTPEINLVSNTRFGNYESCGFQKECVPRRLCRNNTLNTAGTGIIDVRRGTGRKKPGECGYLDECCELTDKIEVSTPRTPPVRHSDCGYTNPNGIGFRITGGTNEAEFAEFPWMVAILLTDDYNPENIIYTCGGAILAPTVVITAAHCVKNTTPEKLQLRVGEWDTQTDSEILPHYDVLVKEIIKHEGFNRGSMWNDVALLILQEPLEWAENIKPICLPPSNTNFNYQNCFVTGWGKDKFGKDGLYQAILKKVQLPIVPHNQCQAILRTTRHRSNFNLHESFICAGGVKGNDVCTGDGGSPLVCPIPGATNRYYHAGIVSWGIGCGIEGMPGFYGNVAFLRQWIDTKLRSRGIEFSHFTA